MYTQKLDIEAM